MEKYNIQQGLAGFVTVAGHTVFSENTKNDSRFVKEIDDPHGSSESPALQIVSCPVFTRDDYLYVGKDQLSNLPRAIVQLINKKSDDNRSMVDVSPEIAKLLQQAIRFE